MRIEQLELKNFKCFPDLKLTFERPVNLIFGQNASGKTTIAQAMELAITGRYDGATPDFRVRNILTKNGAEEFSISLALMTTNGHATNESASLEIIQKTDINRCRPKPDVILEKLSSDKEVLAALLNTRHFLQAHPDEQKQLLFDLLDIKVNQSNLPQQFRTWLKNHSEIFNKYAISPDDDLLSCLESRPKNLEEGYQEAFEERKLIKRELKSLLQASESGSNLSGPNLESLTTEALQSRIDQARHELGDLHTRIGEARGIVLGEGKQIEREISEISGHLLLLQQDFKSFDSQKETENLQKQRKSHEATVVSIEGGITFRKKLLHDFESNRQKIAELQKKRENLEKIQKSHDAAKINEAEALRTRVKEIERQVEKDQDLLAYCQQAKKRRALQQKLDKLEILTLALSPKGIMEDLLAGALSRLLTEANQLMNQISGGRYTLDMFAEPCPESNRSNGFHIYLVDQTNKTKNNINLASSSEQFRVGIVLQAVLSELAGLRFMLIDGVDILDQPNRGFFFHFLESMAPRFDQILVFCTIGQHYPQNPGLENMDFWVIENGDAKKL